MRCTRISGRGADSTVEDNTSEQEGGGVHLADGGTDDPSVAPLMLTIDDTSIRNNQTKGFGDNDGGGVYLETGSLVVQNASGSRGGGVSVVHAGTVAISGSTFSGNSSNSSSGGGLSVSGADITIDTSTFDGNSARTGGGIALLEFSGFPEVSLTVETSTIHANTSSFAASGGGGIWVNVGGAGADGTVRNSTVTFNTSAIALPLGTGTNCGTFRWTTSSGGSTFANDATCNLGPNDLVAAVNPQLGPLADNNDIAFGGSGDDELDGNAGRDLLLGGRGQDVLRGGPGRDFLVGGRDADALDGGAGRDVCIERTGPTTRCFVPWFLFR